MFAEMLVRSKADLKQVENEATAIKHDVLGLSFLLCNRTQRYNLSTGSGWSSEHFVFHISPAELWHNFYRSRCPLQFSHTIKFPIWETGTDLGPDCDGSFFQISLLAQRIGKNCLAGYPTIFLLWIYQWEVAGDPFESRQAGVTARSISFSCKVDLNRTVYNHHCQISESLHF